MGAVEVSAFDVETQEMLYTFTDKFKDMLPDLYDIHMNAIHRELMSLWEAGMVEIENLESENPIVRLSEKAFEKEELKKLSDQQRISLDELKRILKVI